jgi:hypothetical protein
MSPNVLVVSFSSALKSRRGAASRLGRTVSTGINIASAGGSFGRSNKERGVST